MEKEEAIGEKRLFQTETMVTDTENIKITVQSIQGEEHMYSIRVTEKRRLRLQEELITLKAALIIVLDEIKKRFNEHKYWLHFKVLTKSGPKFNTGMYNVLSTPSVMLAHKVLSQMDCFIKSNNTSVDGTIINVHICHT